MPPVATTTPKTAKARKPAAKASAAKGAASARRNGAARTSPLASSNTSYAERAVLIPVGAALIARERVVSTVNETLSTYSSGTKTQAQLRRFERRGDTARKRIEREIRKARVSVERELRKRRQDGEGLADRLQERIQSLV
ncbi:MAG TPA: hypothetical protein VMG62_02895 [Solirubrobacteraceae bacterium]|nr:hypothetical protein [Solirubrobacteraceae bacterium]